MKLHLLLLLALSTESKWVKKPKWKRRKQAAIAANKQQAQQASVAKLTDLTDNEHTMEPKKLKNFVQPDMFKTFLGSKDMEKDANTNSPAYNAYKAIQRTGLEKLLTKTSFLDSGSRVHNIAAAPTSEPDKYLANLHKRKRMGPAAQAMAAKLRAQQSSDPSYQQQQIRRRIKAPTIKPKMKNKIYTIPSRPTTSTARTAPKTTIAPLKENNPTVTSQRAAPTISIIPKKIKKAAKYAKKGTIHYMTA